MRPAFEVKGHNRGAGEGARRFDGLLSSHGEMERAYFRHEGCAEVEDGGADWKAVGYFGDAFVPDRVAGEVDHLLRRVSEEEHEADHGPAIVALWAVTGGRGDDSQDTSLRREIDALPGFQSRAVTTQPGCAYLRGENCSRVREQTPAGVVEIVKVVIVAEEHVIERTDARGD